MDNLVKFCPPEFNILYGCHTIRFGTLEYYRALDPSFAIADEDEGKETIDFRSLQFGTASEEAVKSIEHVISLGPNSSITNCQLDGNFLNCFIWCCSRAVKPISKKEGIRFGFEYSSFYVITDGESFGNHLSQLLGNFIWGKAVSSNAPEETPKDCIQNLSSHQNMREIRVCMFHHDVIYVDEKKSVIDEGELNHPYAKNIPIQLRQLFAKSKKYEEDHEHRFVFLLLNKQGNLLAVRKEPVHLRIDPVSRHLIDQTIVANNDRGGKSFVD